MKKMLVRLLAALLALFLAGCGGSRPTLTSFQDMAYSRPDMAALQRTLDDAVAVAQGTDLEAILEGVYCFYDAYDWFYTCYNLADIHYCCDLSDLYWSQEYDYCVQQSPQVDAALEELYQALAQSPCRETLEAEYFGEGFFLDYDGERLYSETLTACMEREAQLQSQYYALSYQAEQDPDAAEGKMAELLVELIELRQQMASVCGYDDYVSFANDFYYYRDYTPEQMESYLQDIQSQLPPLYQAAASDLWQAAYAPCSQTQTYRYVQQTAQALGGRVEEAFQQMDRAGLYHISYGQNKYSTSFEVYLPSYYAPFLFLNPTGSAYDQLTMAHEFGHFCNDYASFGSYGGIDVAEFFSQGMEYLSLCYGDGTLTQAKLADSLSVYVEQAAYASFELEMYRLTGESLTAQNLQALYLSSLECYGIDVQEVWDFVYVTHFYTNPMYIFSYIVSNDAAMQLYQRELEVPGAGRDLYEAVLDTQQSYFLAFLEEAELESPFTPGRIQAVANTFAQALDLPAVNAA